MPKSTLGSGTGTGSSFQEEKTAAAPHAKQYTHGEPGGQKDTYFKEGGAAAGFVIGLAYGTPLEGAQTGGAIGGVVEAGATAEDEEEFMSALDEGLTTATALEKGQTPPKKELGATDKPETEEGYGGATQKQEATQYRQESYGTQTGKLADEKAAAIKKQQYEASLAETNTPYWMYLPEDVA